MESYNDEVNNNNEAEEQVQEYYDVEVNDGELGKEDGNVKMYWNVYKLKQRARKKIDDVINNIRKTQGGDAVKGIIYGRIVDEVIAYAPVELVKEGIVCAAFIKHLKDLRKTSQFFKTVADSFGNQLDDAEFCRWLSVKLDIRPTRFAASLSAWKNKQFEESRGRKPLNPDIKQLIYNEWKENSIYSVDRRNGCDKVKISKLNCIKKYNDIEKEELIEEEINTRGRLFYCCPRMIATCTLNQLKHKVYEKHRIEVSLGTMLNLKPFFITYATEKEKVLCMCKLCLNTRLLFSPIMEHTKSSGGQEFTSITEYFKHSCDCPRALNGYYQYRYCEGKCKECKKN